MHTPFEKKIRENFTSIEFDTLQEFVVDFIDTIEDEIKGKTPKLIATMAENIENIATEQTRMFARLDTLDTGLTKVLRGLLL